MHTFVGDKAELPFVLDTGLFLLFLLLLLCDLVSMLHGLHHATLRKKPKGS